MCVSMVCRHRFWLTKDAAGWIYCSSVGVGSGTKPAGVAQLCENVEAMQMNPHSLTTVHAEHSKYRCPARHMQAHKLTVRRAAPAAPL